MSTYVNYLIEANLALCLMLLVFHVFLKQETDFSFKRVVLLIGILCSLTFPLFHFQNEGFMFIGEIMPQIWLPEFRVGEESHDTLNVNDPVPFWTYIGYLYIGGVILSLCIFVVQLVRISIVIQKSQPVRHGRLLIAETNKALPSFSFFNFILLGNAGTLSSKDKLQILSHEEVHASKLHSLDILLLNILSIFFWFNPVLFMYKRIFIHLHEFEADSRAVENTEMNEYCNLLARVALLSADLRIANHFSNSLTLKRIQMMKSIKVKIKRWKILSLAGMVPLLFFVLSCNDQVMKEVTDIAQASTMALDVPKNVQERYDFLTQSNPEKKYILLEMSGTDNAKLSTLEKQYGLPVSMELFEESQPPMRGQSEAGVILRKGKTGGSERSYVILEYNSDMQKLGDLSQQDNVYTIVDKSASFPGGFTEFYDFLSAELRYPTDAKREGAQGKVFVEFIVELDGSITNISVVKGVHPLLDAESLRVMAKSPKWEAGMHKGEKVGQKMVLPINFSLGDVKPKKTSSLMEILNPIPPVKNAEDKC